MKYKVGDEVFVKGKILEIDKTNPHYQLNVDIPEFGEFWSPCKLVYQIDKTYEQGLADAWELAKKIMLATDDGGISLNDITEIFGSAYCALRDFTYEEALAKIEAYESENEIKVGDVVKVDGLHCVVTAVYKDSADVLFKDGSCENSDKTHIENTGKHLEVDDLLRQIGE